MTFSRLPDPFRRILWVTALAAAFGAAYSEMHVLQRGGHALAYVVGEFDALDVHADGGARGGCAIVGGG